MLDLGYAIAGISWAPYSSTVFIATTDDGTIYVYDVSVSKCRPLCTQTIAEKQKVIMSCLSMSNFHPVILIGGDK